MYPVITRSFEKRAPGRNEPMIKNIPKKKTLHKALDSIVQEKN